MNPSLSFLIASGGWLLLAIFAQGLKEPKGGLHSVAFDAEQAERRYNRWRRIQRWSWALMAASLAASFASYVIPQL